MNVRFAAIGVIDRPYYSHGQALRNPFNSRPNEDAQPGRPGQGVYVLNQHAKGHHFQSMVLTGPQEEQDWFNSLADSVKKRLKEIGITSFAEGSVLRPPTVSPYSPGAGAWRLLPDEKLQYISRSQAVSYSGRLEDIQRIYTALTVNPATGGRDIEKIDDLTEKQYKALFCPPVHTAPQEHPFKVKEAA